MVSPVEGSSPLKAGDVCTEESGLHVEESGSFLSTIGRLLSFFSLQKPPQESEPCPRIVGIGSENYKELYGRLAAVRYEVISLRAQIEAFQRMSAWSQRVDLETLRRPDLEKVGRRLQAKEEELNQLINEQTFMEQANLQHANVEALCFEEDYLKYLITEILDKGDPESSLTQELICALGALKKDLLVEKEKLGNLRVMPQRDGSITPT